MITSSAEANQSCQNKPMMPLADVIWATTSVGVVAAPSHAIARLLLWKVETQQSVVGRPPSQNEISVRTRRLFKLFLPRNLFRVAALVTRLIGRPRNFIFFFSSFVSVICWSSAPAKISQSSTIICYRPSGTQQHFPTRNSSGF